MSGPKASRPVMPKDYGIAGPREGKGLLPWSWAVKRLTRSRQHWLATTRPDGRPHVMPVWGVWLGDRYYFSTSPQSRKGRNLAANPRCVICGEDADEPVIVEGVAERVGDEALLKRVHAAYRKKYAEDLDPETQPLFGVRPQVAFGFISEPGTWAKTATRWRF